MATQLKERAKLNGHGPAPTFDLAPPGTGGSRRRVPEIAAGVLVIVVCALVALWWQMSSTDTRPVLALRESIERGHVLTVNDLKVVDIATDAEVTLLADSDAGLIVGQIARSDLPAGAMVVPEQFSAGSLLEDGQGVVGLYLEAGQFPTLSLSSGDAVAVVLTPAAGDPRAFDTDTNATVLVDDATVVEVGDVGTQGRLFVSIQVDEVDAAKVASAASANRVRLIQVAGGGA